MTLSQPCEKHASCHKTEFCSVEGCDKCRYCLHGSDSINKRCPCGPGRKSAKPTDVAATAAASEQAARVEQRAKLRNGRGKPVRVRLSRNGRNGKGRFKGFIVVAAPARAKGDSPAGAAEGRLAPMFGGHLRRDAHVMNCWGNPGLSHLTAKALPEVGVTLYPEVGESTTRLSVVVLTKCRGGSRHCEWYQFSQTLRTDEAAGTAVLEPPYSLSMNKTKTATTKMSAAKQQNEEL